MYFSLLNGEIELSNYHCGTIAYKIGTSATSLFAVWKIALTNEIQWTWKFRKAGHSCWSFCPGFSHHVNIIRGFFFFFFAFPLLTSGYELLFCLNNIIFIKFTSLSNRQRQYVVGCVAWSSFDSEQPKRLYFFLFQFSNFGKIKLIDETF